MSSGPARKLIERFRGSAAASPKPDAHEPRASFRPAKKPGRRAAAAGLDRLDLAESHEQARRSGSRRRERQFAEQSYEQPRFE